MSNVSPDISTYIDLTLYDADPTTLYQRFVLNAQQLIPGWQPTAGTEEVTIAQSLCLVICEIVFAINRLPGATVQTLLQLYGITRGVGAPAAGTVTFALTGATAVDIPLGTTMQLVIGAQAYNFATTADSGTIAEGTYTATVPVQCTTNVSAPNGTPEGTPLTLLSGLPWVNSVTVDEALSGGADPQTVSSWLNQGAQFLQAQSYALTLPTQFTAAALLDTADNVYRATTTSNWDSTLSGGSGAAVQGVVTVSVLGEGDVQLTTDQQNSLLAKLEAQAMAGLTIRVADPTVTTINVTATVWQEPGWTSSQVQANVAAQLAAAMTATPPGAGLSTDLWPFDQNVVRRNDLITVITQTPGVAYVITLASPSADVALPGIAPLAELGTVNITVEGP